MLTGERLQYLADLLPENVSWGDPLNAVMLDQILAAHSAGAQGSVAIPDGWMLVKRERIEEIREYARTEFVNSYLGRNNYDERLSRQNERIGEEALSNIRDALSCIGLDEEDRIAAHPQPMTQTDAARDVVEAARIVLGAGLAKDISGNGVKVFVTSVSAAERLSAAIAEIERLDRAKGE